MAETQRNAIMMSKRAHNQDKTSDFFLFENEYFIDIRRNIQQNTDITNEITTKMIPIAALLPSIVPSGLLIKPVIIIVIITTQTSTGNSSIINAHSFHTFSRRSQYFKSDIRNSNPIDNQKANVRVSNPPIGSKKDSKKVFFCTIFSFI